MKKVVVLLCCLPLFLLGQEEKVFSFQSFMQQVKSEHPLAKQADLQMNLGDENLKKAKGGFDPKLQGDYNDKQFEDANYYDLLNAGLKVPTWFGLTVDAGYTLNQGEYLNPENKTPTNGLYHLGAQLPLGKGLFIDQRRADLQQAKIFSQATDAERKSMLNSLLLDAGYAYFKWLESYQNYQVFIQAKDLAQVRFDGVKQAAMIGEGPEIDTLEAGIQLQNRMVQLQQAELQLSNARALVEVYLWQDGNVPLELEGFVTPEMGNGLNALQLETQLMDDAYLQEHPELLAAKFKVAQLEVEQRMTREMLKPELNLKYNALANADFNNEVQSGIGGYTWGASFSMPIFLRKERGQNRMAKIKVEQANFGVETKQAQLKYKAEVALNTFQNLQEQIVILAQNVEDYAQLLEGERQLFNAGESSLFMVNSREMNYVNTQVKLNKMQAEKQVAALQVYYALGVLYQQ